jgi:hypothetical protein
LIAVLTARGFSSHRLPARFNDRLDFDLDLLGKHVDHILVDATKLAALRVLVASAPSIVNQFTVIVKSSTLVSVITVPVMSQSQRLVNIWYEPIEILTATQMPRGLSARSLWACGITLICHPFAARLPSRTFPLKIGTANSDQRASTRATS